MIVMAVLHLFLWSFNVDLHACLRQVSSTSIQYVSVALQYEEASSCSISLKVNFCNFTPWMPGAVALFGPPLYATDQA